jgi:hypothetical protein
VRDKISPRYLLRLFSGGSQGTAGEADEKKQRSHGVQQQPFYQNASFDNSECQSQAPFLPIDTVSLRQPIIAKYREEVVSFF